MGKEKRKNSPCANHPTPNGTGDLLLTALQEIASEAGTHIVPRVLECLVVTRGKYIRKIYIPAQLGKNLPWNVAITRPRIERGAPTYYARCTRSYTSSRRTPRAPGA
jgi:hypothetical protein